MPDWGDKFSKVMDRLGALQNYIAQTYMENVDVEHIGTHPDGPPGSIYTDNWTPFSGGWAINGEAGFKYLYYLHKINVTKNSWKVKLRLMANFSDEEQTIHFYISIRRWHDGVFSTLQTSTEYVWTSPDTAYTFEEKLVAEDLSISAGDLVCVEVEKKGDVHDGDHNFTLLGAIWEYT